MTASTRALCGWRVRLHGGRGRGCTQSAAGGKGRGGAQHSPLPWQLDAAARRTCGVFVHERAAAPLTADHAGPESVRGLALGPWGAQAARSQLLAPQRQLLQVTLSSDCLGAGNFGACLRATMVHADDAGIAALRGLESAQRYLEDPSSMPMQLTRSAVAAKVLAGLVCRHAWCLQPRLGGHGGTGSSPPWTATLHPFPLPTATTTPGTACSPCRSPRAWAAGLSMTQRPGRPARWAG